MRKNILVTGAGAVLGQGILRCINERPGDFFIHTADPDRRSTGHWLGHKAHIIPFASDSKYLEVIEQIITKENIDVVLVGTDVELPIFATYKQRLEQTYPVKIVVSNDLVISIANDKRKTADFLEQNNLPYPYSYLTSDQEGIKLLIEKSEYPYFAKPIDGARSKGILLINNKEDLEEITSYPNNLVVQEFLSEDEGEFTSGCVVLNGKTKAVVTLKRDLRDGNTYRAYYKEEYEKYTPFIAQVAESLGVEGPCNFQFRIKENKPLIFEINARFSGTTPIRSFFGFNEVLAILDSIFFNKEIEQPQLKEGMVLRAWADIFVAQETVKEFAESDNVISLQGIYHPFMK